MKTDVQHTPDADDALTDPLARAEAAIAALSDSYRESAIPSARKLADLTIQLLDEPSDSSSLDTIFRIAHDLKGQGGSFGYPLVSCLAQPICELTRGRESLEPAEVERAVALAAGIKGAIENNLVGDGGRQGRELLALLDVQMD